MPTNHFGGGSLVKFMATLSPESRKKHRSALPLSPRGPVQLGEDISELRDHGFDLLVAQLHLFPQSQKALDAIHLKHQGSSSIIPTGAKHPVIPVDAHKSPDTRVQACCASATGPLPPKSGHTSLVPPWSIPATWVTVQSSQRVMLHSIHLSNSSTSRRLVFAFPSSLRPGSSVSAIKTPKPNPRSYA